MAVFDPRPDEPILPIKGSPTKPLVPGSNASYGLVIPVLYGSGWVKGVCAFAPSTPVPGTGAEFKENATTGALVRTDAAAIYGAPLAYVFSLGVINSFKAVSRGDLRFEIGSGTCPPARTNDLVGYSPTVTYYAPDMFLGNPATVSGYDTVGAGLAAYYVSFGHFSTLRAYFVICPDKRFPEMKALLEGRLGSANVPTTGSPVTTLRGATPAPVLHDIVEDTTVGVGLAAGTVVTDVGADGLAASSYERYMAARGWLICRAFAEGTARDAIAEIMAATDTTVYAGLTLKFIPNSADALTKNGYTYTPPSTAIAFDDDSIVIDGSNSDPVEATRRPESDVSTVIPVTYGPVYSADGSRATVEAMDSARSYWGTLGVRRGQALDLPCIPEEQHAREISQVAAQQSIYNRTTFRWRSSWRTITVEPGDLVTLTHAMMGMSAVIARVTSWEESDDGIAFEAEEYFPGSAVTSLTLAPTSDGIGTNPLIGMDAGSVVLSFGSDSILSTWEIPAALTAWNDLWGSKANLEASALVALISASPFTAAVQALGDYLNAGSAYTTGTPAWLASAVDVAIVAATWQTKWGDAYNERNALIHALADEANRIASSGGGGANVLYNSSFVVASAGVPLGWATYNNEPAIQPSTVSVTQTGGPFGDAYYRHSWAVNNTITKGINSTTAGVNLSNVLRLSQWYVYSFYARASSTNIGKTMVLCWNNTPTNIVTMSNPALTSGWQRYAFKIAWTSGTIDPQVFISIELNSGTQGNLDLACPQVSEGEALGAWSPRADEASLFNIVSFGTYSEVTGVGFGSDSLIYWYGLTSDVGTKGSGCTKANAMSYKDGSGGSYLGVLTVSVDTLEAFGTGTAGAGTFYTNYVTATPSGKPSYTYAWTKMSGNTFTVSASTSATTRFSYTFGGPGTVTGQYECRVSDSTGQVISTGAVAVTIDNT
jgi:hypothetical protein